MYDVYIGKRNWAIKTALSDINQDDTASMFLSNLDIWIMMVVLRLVLVCKTAMIKVHCPPNCPTTTATNNDNVHAPPHQRRCLNF